MRRIFDKDAIDELLNNRLFKEEGVYADYWEYGSREDGFVVHYAVEVDCECCSYDFKCLTIPREELFIES